MTEENKTNISLAWATTVYDGKYNGQVFVRSGEPCPGCETGVLSKSVQSGLKLCMDCFYDPQAGDVIPQPSHGNNYGVRWDSEAQGGTSKQVRSDSKKFRTSVDEEADKLLALRNPFRK